jgi:hypothetical protein
MSGGFKCQMCGWCCEHITSGGWMGLSLFPWEKHLFPRDRVLPHLGFGRDPEDPGFRVFLYRYVDPVCEKFVGGRCSIHETRPLVCRSYPFRYVKRGESGSFYEGAPECRAIDHVGPGQAKMFSELYAAEEIGMQLEGFYKKERKWEHDPVSETWVPYRMGKA